MTQEQKLRHLNGVGRGRKAPREKREVAHQKARGEQRADQEEGDGGTNISPDEGAIAGTVAVDVAGVESTTHDVGEEGPWAPKEEEAERAVTHEGVEQIEDASRDRRRGPQGNGEGSLNGHPETGTDHGERGRWSGHRDQPTVEV